MRSHERGRFPVQEIEMLRLRASLNSRLAKPSESSFNRQNQFYHMKTRLSRPDLLLCFALLLPCSAFAAETKPLRALLITGGCCHDYAKQKDILKKGIEERANVEVVQ